jgi:hypothetical protein
MEVLMSWIINWLIVGLFFNWLGLMMLRYGKKDASPFTGGQKWWMEIVAICLWPFALAFGFVAGVIGKRK